MLDRRRRRSRRTSNGAEVGGQRTEGGFAEARGISDRASERKAPQAALSLLITGPYATSFIETVLRSPSSSIRTIVTPPARPVPPATPSPRRRSALPQQVRHDVHGLLDVMEERLVSQTEIVQPRLTLGRVDEPVARALAEARKQDVATVNGSSRSEPFRPCLAPSRA